jgi:hypothetical protein
MGTLSKKGIINNFQWHFIYLFQYALAGYLFYKNTDIISFKNFIIVLILWFLRTKISMNKFFLWSCVSVIFLFTKYVKSNILLVGCLTILYSIFNYFGMCFDKKRERYHNVIKTNMDISNTKLHVI